MGNAGGCCEARIIEHEETKHFYPDKGTLKLPAFEAVNVEDFVDVDIEEAELLLTDE